MIKFFKNNTLLQLIIIIAVALASWLMTKQTATMPAPIDSAPLYNILYKLLSPYPIVSSIIAMILILGEGVLLAVILNGHKMIPQNTALPMLFIVVSAIPNGFSLSPILFVNLIILIVLHKLLLKGTLLTVSLDTVITAATWMAIASLFFFPAVFLLIPFILSFIIFNIYSWRCIAMTILGYLAPYIIYIAILLGGGLTFQIPLIDQEHYLALFHFSIPNILEAIFFLAAILGIFSVLDSQRERIVIYRKNTSLILLIVLSALLMSVFVTWKDDFSEILQLFVIPFSYALSLLFLNAKGKKWIWDTLFAITIFAPIIAGFFNL